MLKHIFVVQLIFIFLYSSRRFISNNRVFRVRVNFSSVSYINILNVPEGLHFLHSFKDHIASTKLFYLIELHKTCFRAFHWYFLLVALHVLWTTQPKFSRSLSISQLVLRIIFFCNAESFSKTTEAKKENRKKI